MHPKRLDGIMDTLIEYAKAPAVIGTLCDWCDTPAAFIIRETGRASNDRDCGMHAHWDGRTALSLLDRFEA